MPRTVTLREKVADNGFLRESRQGYWCNKFLACRGDDHLHLSTGLDETANNQTGLIRCDRARDTQYDFFTFQHDYIALRKTGQNPVSHVISVLREGGYGSAPAWYCR